MSRQAFFANNAAAARNVVANASACVGVNGVNSVNGVNGMCVGCNAMGAMNAMAAIIGAKES